MAEPAELNILLDLVAGATVSVVAEGATMSSAEANEVAVKQPTSMNAFIAEAETCKTRDVFLLFFFDIITLNPTIDSMSYFSILLCN
ncbi:MAG TPA: hypothetical protein VIH30_07590 [Aquirhabdus sp.]